MSALALFSCPPLALFLLSSLLFLFHDPYLALFYRPGPRHLSFLQSETQGGTLRLVMGLPIRGGHNSRWVYLWTVDNHWKSPPGGMGGVYPSNGSLEEDLFGDGWLGGESNIRNVYPLQLCVFFVSRSLLLINGSASWPGWAAVEKGLHTASACGVN